MNAIWSILSGVPAWVYIVFAYGIYSGVRACSGRTVKVAVLLVLPLVFLGLSLSSLVPLMGREPLVAVAWTLCVALGGIVSWFFLTKEPLSVQRVEGTLAVAGTPVILILFLVIFVVKFVYGYVTATNPELASDPGFLLTVFGLSGLSTGVMVARNTKLYVNFLQDTDRRMA